MMMSAPYRTFDKLRRVAEAAVVENKRSAGLLALIRQSQEAVTNRHTNRDKPKAARSNQPPVWDRLSPCPQRPPCGAGRDCVFDPLQALDSHGTSAVMLTQIKSWAKGLKRDVVALWIAARSPRTPMAAKLVAGAVAAYALSPIDLIPDFIPLIGYLDDLVIVPLGIALAVRLIPPVLMAEFRAEALAVARPVNRLMAVAIVVLWLVVFLIASVWYWRKVR